MSEGATKIQRKVVVNLHSVDQKTSIPRKMCNLEIMNYCLRSAWAMLLSCFIYMLLLCFYYNCIVSSSLSRLWTTVSRRSNDAAHELDGSTLVLQRPALLRAASPLSPRVVFSWLLHKKVLCLSVCAQLTFLILFFISLVVYAWLPKLHWVHYGFLAGTKDNRGTWG